MRMVWSIVSIRIVNTNSPKEGKEDPENKQAFKCIARYQARLTIEK